MPSKIAFFEASKLVSTKTREQKHYYRRQGIGAAQSGLHENYAMSRTRIPPELFYVCDFDGGGYLVSIAPRCSKVGGRAKGAEKPQKASYGETVVQAGVFGESVSSLPP